MKQRIAIDMDEVIADTLKARLERYKLDFGVTYTLQDLHGKRIYDVIPEAHLDQVREVMDEPGFFRNLEVFPEAKEVVQELNERYEVFIATAAMEVPKSFADKYEWLLEHFPFLDSQHFVFCGKKSVILADYLIDDNPTQLKQFRGEGIMYSSPSNINDNGFKRVNNWAEVRSLFLR